MKKQVTARMISLLLVVALLAGFAVPASAAAQCDITLTVTDNAAVGNPLRPQQKEEQQQTAIYGPEDVVRVSIMLEDASTLKAGYSTIGISTNAAAMAYRTELKNQQAAVTTRIEQATGQKLDVVWNLTLAANIISANVGYGKLNAIAQIPGVEKVILETRYEPKEAVTSTADKPNMMVSANMTGATQVWDIGYTGGGTRIAVIDTGLDTDHQSFDPNALAHALAENAELAGVSYEEYLAQADLLDTQEIAEKLPQLNVAERSPELAAEDLYFNLKTPFGYNYLDVDVDITHDNDSEGSHGSHVAGIATANRFLRRGNNYVSAADTVAMQGSAPDAQIIVMKVFGKLGGAYDSDYMAALEDALILDCDAVNLSLGSSSPGFTTSKDYQDLMNYLTQTDTVVAIAAGNEGYWAVNSSGVLPNLYIEDVNFQTAGSPGTYENAFTVASVNNDGAVGPSLNVAGNSIGYSDGDGYYNEPMAALDTTGEGTEYEYVFLNSNGQVSDYTGIDVTGKIVFVSRGETNFADKAQVAYDHGAIASVVYNNELEGINMILDGYYEDAPCVIISMAKGQMVKENSTAATTDAGVTYYTGTLTINSKVNANVEHSEYYTMSSFSSWGVPGDLTMKPEITAPGGNIYSINGAVPETDQYEMMSGTSMATPQVAGLSALVQQVIDARELSQEGLTDRALTQSLLMSTAKPLKDANGAYYSILQQGAGLADVMAATSADSYILVDGQDDGKVKVELGDDPDRMGEYAFSFQISNLDNEETIFALSADMFTQDAFVYYANLEAAEQMDDSTLAAFLDTATRAMDFTVNWTTDGQMVTMDADVVNCDFDADGDTDKDDAQALLDYVTGMRESIDHAEYADVSGDGDVDTYDVHVLLAKLQDAAVAVPGGGTVNVTVELTLTEEEKEYLDTYYTNGAYVQAFIYADAITDAEGVDGTCHSIPVLGFYGNWTDPSMFENGTVQGYAAGDELHDPYTGTDAVNSLSVEYARDPGYVYYMGGNPVVADSTYRPERNAFNNQNGDKISTMQFNPIRNVATSRLTVTNATTGEVLREASSGSIYGAYYGVVFFIQMWLEGIYDYPIHWAPKDVAEGDVLEFTVDAAPEYYVDDNGNVDWDALGDGATLTIPVTMDCTAPVLSGVSVDVLNNTLEIRASDNQYVAAVALFNGSGKEVLTYVGSKDEAVPGETYSYELDLSKANGNKFLVQVYDYAYNMTTYELRMDLGDVPPLPDMIAFDKQYDYYWTAFSLGDRYWDLTIYSETDVVFNAATIDNHYVFACTDTGDLYVMPETDLSDMTRIRSMGVVFNDMAYNSMDDQIYGVAYNEAGQSVLYTIDRMVGTISEVGVIGLNTNTLACDPSGTFYCNEYGTSKVYTFTLDTLAEPVYMLEVLDDLDEPFETRGVQAMEYDPNTHNVVWASYYYEERTWGDWGYSFLYELHPNTNTFTRYEDMSHELVALVIPQSGAGGDWSQPTDEILSLELPCQTMSIMRGYSERLTVTILPWTVSDNTVTWTSANPSIADVDQYGLVTGVKPGTTTITATSNLDPSFSDSVTVTVEALPIDMEGVLLTNEGDPVGFTWDVLHEDTWTAGIELDTVLLGGTEDADGNVLGVIDDAKTVVEVDMTTGVSTKLGTWDTQMYDMAYSNLFSDETTHRVHMLSGSFWIPAKDPADPSDDEAWDLFDYIFDKSYAFEFVAIATGDIVTVEDAGQTHQAEEVFLLDDNGYVWKLHAYADGDFYNSTEPVCYASNLQELGYELVRLEETMLPLSSMVVGEDGNLYFSAYTGTTNVFYQLKLDDETMTCEAVPFGTAGDEVWPAIVVDVNGQDTAANNSTIHTSGSTLNQTAQRVHLSASGSSRKQPLSVLNTDEEKTITVANDVDVTNGLFTVEYSEELVTLKSVHGNACLTSVSEESGKVTFGYADVDVLTAGNPVANMVFAPKPGVETAEVTVTITQQNDAMVELVQTITLAFEQTDPGLCQHTHTEIRHAAEPTCSADGYTGDTYCTDCGELLAEGEVIPAYCPTAEYTDVPLNAWFHDAVDYVVAHGMMEGTGEGIFAPNGATTRAQMVTVLYRLAGSPEVEPTEQFKDVATDEWYAKAVAWAAENEITTGLSDDLFAPAMAATREQVVTFLYRYARFMEPDVTAEGDLSRFTDAHKVSAYAADAFIWAVNAGVINGMTDTTLVPQGTSIRAQIATILMRFAQLSQ